MIKKKIKDLLNSYIKIPRLSFPSELEFEPIQLCNALCFTCPYTRLQKDNNYKGKKMSREQIKLILTDFAGLIKKNRYKGPTVINPFRYSDPLVCKDLDLIMELAKANKLKVKITTNGVSFNDYYSELLNRYINYLALPIDISVIGSNAEKIKKNMNVNLEITLSRLKKLKKNYPHLASLVRINLSEVDESENEKVEIENLKSVFISIGFKVNIRKKWINNRIDGDWKITANSINDTSNFVIGCNLYKNKLLRRIEVMVDGSVVLCDDDAQGKLKFGNVFNDGIEKIWNGPLLEYHKKIYNKNYNNDKKKLICNSCSRAETKKNIYGFTDTFIQSGKIKILKHVLKSNVQWF
jgi:radical SAM protein with 4Fe4S-binding SPASM domain